MQREQRMCVNSESEADHAGNLQMQHPTKLAADLVAAKTRLKATYDKRVTELQMQHSSEPAAELLATKSELKAAHDNKIKDLQLQHQSELAEAEQHLSDFVDDFEDMKRHRDYYEGALLDTERSMDELRSVCKALDSDRSMHEAALAAALKVIDAQVIAFSMTVIRKVLQKIPDLCYVITSAMNLPTLWLHYAGFSRPLPL